MKVVLDQLKRVDEKLTSADQANLGKLASRQRTSEYG